MKALKIFVLAAVLALAILPQAGAISRVTENQIAFWDFQATTPLWRLLKSPTTPAGSGYFSLSRPFLNTLNVGGGYTATSGSGLTVSATGATSTNGALVVEGMIMQGAAGTGYGGTGVSIGNTAGTIQAKGDVTVGTGGAGTGVTLAAAGTMQTSGIASLYGLAGVGPGSPILFTGHIKPNSTGAKVALGQVNAPAQITSTSTNALTVNASHHYQIWDMGAADAYNLTFNLAITDGAWGGDTFEFRVKQAATGGTLIINDSTGSPLVSLAPDGSAHIWVVRVILQGSQWRVWSVVDSAL